jgi:serine/threonine protein kinase
VLTALAHLHDVVGAVHRDVKLENVLLVGAPPPEQAAARGAHQRTWDVRLADFGSARFLERERAHSFLGSVQV